MARGVSRGDIWLKQDSAINLDHVQTVRQEDLKKYVATLPPDVMRRVCGALAVATGCGSE